MKSPKKGKIYRFEWNDTYSFDGWKNEEEIKELTLKNPLQITIGFFIEETDRWYIIGTNKNSHEHYKTWGCITWIPRGVVEKIQELT